MILHAKIALPDSQRDPLKLCLIKHELDINVFVSLNMFVFNCGFSAKVTYAFLVSNGEIHSNKHFSSQENDGIFHIFKQIKFSRVPLATFNGFNLIYSGHTEI